MKDSRLAEANKIARRVVLRCYGRSWKNWKFPLIRVKDVKRGRFYPKTNSITLPEWLWLETRKGYLEYYIAHELAHAISGIRNHSVEFQLFLHRLCPKYHFYEMEYMPTMYRQFIREFAITK